MRRERVRYTVYCGTCGYLSTQRLQRNAKLRATRHETVQRTPEPGVVHECRVERSPKLEAK